MRNKIIGVFLLGTFTGICIMGVAFICYLGGEFTHRLEDVKKVTNALEENVQRLNERVLYLEAHRHHK